MVFALLFLLVLNVAMPLAAQPAVYQAPERADVLVVGGSPAGIAAAIAAARQGRSVVLVEPRPFLGTVLTGAMLNTFDLNRMRDGRGLVEGIFAEVYRELGLTFDPRFAREFFRRKVASEKGIRLYLGTQVLHPVRKGNAVLGAIVQNRTRRWMVLAPVTIDATDDGDFAAASGAEYTLGREDSGIDRLMQAATLLFRLGGVDWPAVIRYIRENDKPFRRGGVRLGYAWGYRQVVRGFRSPDPRIAVVDMNLGRQPDGTVWVNALQVFGVDGTSRASRKDAYTRAKRLVPVFATYLKQRAPGFENASLIEVAPELYIRETRHVKGLYVLTADDILRQRVFWDRIAIASYPIDLHPYRAGERSPFAPRRRTYTIPLRSLIVRGIDNLFVASRAFSATYQAAGSARVVPTTMAMGEAAGVAAAVAVEYQVSPHVLIRRQELVGLVQLRLLGSGARIDP